jgi:hypothetical protein
MGEKLVKIEKSLVDRGVIAILILMRYKVVVLLKRIF